jgi:hypothetical protein
MPDKSFGPMITAEEGRQAEWNLLKSQPNKTSQKYCSLRFLFPGSDFKSVRVGEQPFISSYFQHY